MKKREKTTFMVAQGGGYLAGNFTQDVSQTLTAIQAGHNAMAIITENSVTEDGKMEETKTFDARGNGDGDTVNTLTGGHAAIGFNPGQSKDGGLGLEEGVSPNIRANSSANDPAVAIAENIIGRRPENGGHQLGVNETGAAYTQEAMSPQGVCHNATVRRLLPVECERLQGFQDGHTVPCFRPEDITDELVDRFVEIHYEWAVIENGGSPVKIIEDEDGKCHEVPIKRKSAKQVREWLAKISSPDTCPDAPRYKAVGNSMAVNCMEWLGRRIQMVEERIQREEKG